MESFKIKVSALFRKQEHVSAGNVICALVLSFHSERGGQGKWEGKLYKTFVDKTPK